MKLKLHRHIKLVHITITIIGMRLCNEFEYNNNNSSNNDNYVYSLDYFSPKIRCICWNIDPVTKKPHAV